MYDPSRHHRRSVRLVGWHYGEAAGYAVTVCLCRPSRAFGDVTGGEMRLSEAGERALACLRDVPLHHTGVRLDAHVVMPDHVHAVLILPDGPDVPPRPGGRPARGSLAVIVGTFKAAVTRQAGRCGAPFQWQRGYYDRIVRDAAELDRHRRYIHDNPRRWTERAVDRGAT